MEVEFSLLLTIIVVLILMVLTVFGYLVYSGLLIKINIKAGTPPFQSLKVAYKFKRDSYNNCEPLFSEVSNLFPGLSSIVIYYDNPKEREAHSLRFIVGAILNDDSWEKDKSLKEKLKNQGFNIITFPAIEHAVMTTFPDRGSVSIMIAVSKVYPKLEEYTEEHQLNAYPVMEIYNGKDIQFVAPLDNHSDFYVPEALEESKDDDYENLEDDGKGDASFGSQASNIPDIKNNTEGLEESKVEEIDNDSHIEHHSENDKNGNNGSDTGTESFEELNFES